METSSLEADVPVDVRDPRRASRLLCSRLSALNSGKINLRIASSTVSNNFGLLMDDLDAPERMERVSKERWLGERLDDRTLESAADTLDSWWPLLDRRREERISSATGSLTLLVLLLERLFRSDDFSFALLSEILTRSLPRGLLLLISPMATPASAPAAAAVMPSPTRDGLADRLSSPVGPEPSRKLSVGIAEISEGLPG